MLVRTSFLSTAWRHLWKKGTCLNFDGDGDSEREVFIDRALFNLESLKIKKLFIKCRCTGTISDCLDSWLRIATRRDVEDIQISFSPDDNVNWSGENWYKIPHYVFKCSSLKSLQLFLCDLNLPPVLQLSSLKKIILEVMDIRENVIGFLTTNCPVLEFLTFDTCNSTRNLYVSVSGRSLKRVTLWEGRETIETDTNLIISAPYLQHLKFRWSLPRFRYSILDLSSLVVLSFKQFFQDSDENNFSEEWQRYGEILGSIVDKCHQLKKLKLCNFLVQVLSMRAVHRLKPLSIHATRIELETKLSKWELPGISFLLKSSPKLEVLVLNPGVNDIKLVHDHKDSFGFDVKEFWDNEKFDISSHLKNLKIVEIGVHVGLYKLGSSDEVLERINISYVKFVAFLLKHASLLEWINIDSSLDKDYESLFKFFYMITTLPRTSTTCGVRIT